MFATSDPILAKAEVEKAYRIKDVKTAALDRLTAAAPLVTKVAYTDAHPRRRGHHRHLHAVAPREGRRARRGLLLARLRRLLRELRARGRPLGSLRLLRPLTIPPTEEDLMTSPPPT